MGKGTPSRRAETHVFILSLQPQSPFPLNLRRIFSSTFTLEPSSGRGNTCWSNNSDNDNKNDNVNDDNVNDSGSGTGNEKDCDNDNDNNN